MVEMVPVDSDAIEKVGFGDGELYIEFPDGDTYVYSVVPESVFDALLVADSKGAFLNREIRPFYDYRKL